MTEPKYYSVLKLQFGFHFYLKNKNTYEKLKVTVFVLFKDEDFVITK